MGYVPGFENDVVISYGHDDDKPPTDRWVWSLHEYILGRLKQICRADVVVWRDPRLEGRDYLEPAVRAAVTSSAVFVSVLSPGFAQKEWCEREAGWFVGAAGPAIDINGKSRIVLAVKSPLMDVPWPASLDRGTLHYRFYDEDEQSGSFSEFPADRTHPDRLKFDQVCEKLTQGLCKILRDLKNDQARRQTASGSSRRTFIAVGTSDIRAYRESVEAELVDRHLEVVAADLQVDQGHDALKGQIATAVDKADIAVHVVGSRYGLIPEGGDESLAALQFRIVREQAAKRPPDRPLTQVVWLPDDVQNLEPRQSEFVDRLRAQTGSGASGFEFVTCKLPKFKEDLLDIVSRREPAAQAIAPTRSVYLLCHRRDQTNEVLQALKAWLMRNGYPTDVPPFQGDAVELQRMEEESITESDATVIFYGSAEDSWVRQKRRAVQKVWAKAAAPAPALQRSRAVYLASPEDESKAAQYKQVPDGLLKELDRVRPLVVLGDCGPFAPDKIQPLLTLFKPAE